MLLIITKTSSLIQDMYLLSSREGPTGLTYSFLFSYAPVLKIHKYVQASFINPNTLTLVLNLITT